MKKRLLSVFLSIVAIIGASATLHQAAKQPRPDRTATTTHVANTANTFSAPQAPVTPQAVGTTMADYESITDWQAIGTAQYTDIFCAHADADTYCYTTYGVEAEESASNPGLYRIKNANQNPESYYGYPDDSKDYYLIVDATDPEAVFIPLQQFGYYANVYLDDAYTYANIWVQSWSTGTLNQETMEITFPDWSLVWRTSEDGTINAANNSNETTFRLKIPGGKDYSMIVTENSACAVDGNASLSITSGADIARIRYTFVQSATATSDQAIEESRTSENTLTNGAHTLPMPAEGRYVLGVTAYDSEGNERTSAFALFYRYDENADLWKTIGQANFTENLVSAAYGSSYGNNEYTVELQESINTPGFYRVVNPLYGNPNQYIGSEYYLITDHNHYLFIHAEDPNAVYMDESPIGLDFGDGDFISKSVGNGTLKNGVITFPAGTIATAIQNYNNCTFSNSSADVTIVIPQEHTVSVKSANENYGTVTITSPATEGNTITTTESSVTVTATPNEGVDFINWTDADGNVISTEAAYTYVGSEDIELTANFGLSLTYTFPEHGYMAVTVNGSTVSSGTILAPGTTIDIKLTPANKYELESFTINGNNIEPNEDGTYSFALAEATVINAIFAQIGHTLTIITEGNGRVEVWSSFDESDDSPAGTQYQSGDKIPNEELIFVYYFPGSEASESETRYEQISSATLSTSAGTINMLSDGYLFTPGFDSNAFTNQENILAESDITISTVFTNDYAALEEIGIDINNGPVEYYNLQGIRISSDNLTPGFYIIRQGSKAAKVLITK